MSSLNKVMLIGNLGQDPEVRAMQSGDKVANLSIATSETWKDKSGQKQEKTEWHRVVIFGKIAEIAEQYLKKGSKVLIEGKLQTRKWTDDAGQDKYTTEVVVTGFGGSLVMLGGNQNNNTTSSNNDGKFDDGSSANPPAQDFDDDIPF